MAEQQSQQKTQAPFSNKALSMLEEAMGANGFLRSMMTSPYTDMKINRDGKVTLNFDPRESLAGSLGAHQKASEIAEPTSLAGIMDPEVMKMIAGMQQQGIEQAYSVPQMLSQMNYQSALTDQASNWDQQMIMRLAGNIYDRLMQGQQERELMTERGEQAKELKAIPEPWREGERELKTAEVNNRAAIMAEEYKERIEANRIRQEQLDRALRNDEQMEKERAIDNARQQAQLDRSLSKDERMMNEKAANAWIAIKEVGGTDALAEPLIRQYYEAYPESTQAPIFIKGILRDKSVMVDLGGATIAQAKEKAKKLGYPNLGEYLKKIYELRK